MSTPPTACALVLLNSYGLCFPEALLLLKVACGVKHFRHWVRIKYFWKSSRIIWRELECSLCSWNHSVIIFIVSIGQQLPFHSPSQIFSRDGTLGARQVLYLVRCSPYFQNTITFDRVKIELTEQEITKYPR